MSTRCPKCGHIHEGHENVYGKVCSKCGHFIKSDQDIPIIKHMKNTNQAFKAKVIEAVRKRLKGED